MSGVAIAAWAVLAIIVTYVWWVCHLVLDEVRWIKHVFGQALANILNHVNPEHEQWPGNNELGDD